MYISEIKLRKIIRNELLNEGYTPTKLFEPVLYGSDESKSVDALFLGGDGKTGIYVLIKGEKPSGYTAVANKSDNLNDMLKKVKATKRGKTINQSGINKLKVALRDGEVFYSSGNRRIFQPLSDDEKAGVVSFMRDSGIEAGAQISGIAAGALTAAGMAPLAAAVEAIGNGFNIADVFNKLSSNPPNYLGAAFAILGLIPGGDTISLLKKIGALDDVFPASLADDLAREIIKLLEGDFQNTVTEIVNSFIEARDMDPDQANPFFQGIIKAGKEIASSFEKMAKAGDTKIKKA